MPGTNSSLGRTQRQRLDALPGDDSLASGGGDAAHVFCLWANFDSGQLLRPLSFHGWRFGGQRGSQPNAAQNVRRKKFVCCQEKGIAFMGLRSNELRAPHAAYSER